jgi:hypothetical protein
VLFSFLKIFPRHNQHPETFAIFLADVFVVHFVRASNRFCVTVIRVSEDFKPLMDEDVVNRKVCNPIREDSQPNRKADA